MPTHLPPVETRFKPGQSGCPGGCRPAGAYVREWYNALAHKGLTEPELRRIAVDTKAPWTKRSAAQQILRTMGVGEVADFEPWLNGEERLQELRNRGIATDNIKKAKIKKTPTANGVIIEREIELHDRAGGALDRIADRTEGKPTQAVQVTGDGVPTLINIIVAQLPTPTSTTARGPTPQAGDPLALPPLRPVLVDAPSATMSVEVPRSMPEQPRQELGYD